MKDETQLKLIETLQNQISAQQVIFKVLIRVLVEKEVISDEELTTKLEDALKELNNETTNGKVEDINEELPYEFSDDELIDYLEKYSGEFGIS